MKNLIYLFLFVLPLNLMAQPKGTIVIEDQPRFEVPQKDNKIQEEEDESVEIRKELDRQDKAEEARQEQEEILDRERARRYDSINTIP